MQIPQKSRSFWNNLLSLRSTEASCEDNVYMAKLQSRPNDTKKWLRGHHGGHIFYRKEESRWNEDHVKLFKDYRATIETELSKICDGILGLLGSHLVPSASSSEAKIFYLKMKGDYFGYLAEFKTGVDLCKEFVCWCPRRKRTMILRWPRSRTCILNLRFSD
ncbi:putative 14-3-3 protein [Helianthus annuus]|nr:putative 14-3-3 protein [Helianthus annuus]